MLTERSRNKALEAFLKGRKVIMMTVFDDGSIAAENLENILSTEDSRYLVDVPAVENPEFKQAVAGMVSDGEEMRMSKVNENSTLEEKIQFISEHYTHYHQIVKTLEELEELHAELDSVQMINGLPVLPGNTWSEMADVLIMCRQLIVQAGKEDEVKRHMQYKLDRQLRRIEDEQKQKGQDVCTDCFGAAGNDCRDCVRGEDGA